MLDFIIFIVLLPFMTVAVIAASPFVLIIGIVAMIILAVLWIGQIAIVVIVIAFVIGGFVKYYEKR